jgi:DhnA family fructose-bisphosphate aldolase class Ia
MSLLASDGKALIVAMDHARTHGVIEGLENPGAVIDMAVAADADAVMTTFGVIKHYRDHLIGRIPTILRLDGGPSLYREDWLAYTEWTLMHSVEDALQLGVDGVVLMAFIGIPVELKTLRIVAKVASECYKAKLPLMVEALPCQSARIPDDKAPDAMASASRLGFEHGADLIKTYYTGTLEGFRQVTENCPVPVLIAGGPRMNTIEDSLRVVEGAMQAGAKGAVFGRNIWQNPNPKGMVRAFQQIIHGGATVEQALDVMRNA